MRTRFGLIGGQISPAPPGGFGLALPTFTPAGGSYPGSGNFSVTINIYPQATKFRYTINDSTLPSLTHGTLVNALSGVVSVPNHGVLRAIAIDAANNVSGITTGTYDHALSMPRGVFLITASGGTINPNVLSHPGVDGVIISLPWYTLQPTENSYDFTYLDGAVAAITAVGKKCLIAIATGSMNQAAGGQKPNWLYTLGIPTFEYIDNSPGGLGPMIIPVQWNQIFLDKKKAMQAAVGAHFADNPTVVAFACNAFNAQTEDWALPSSQVPDGVPPAGSSEASRQVAAGYTHAVAVDAARQIYDSAMSAFGNQFIYSPIGYVTSLLMEPAGKEALAEEVIANLRTSWGNRFLHGYNAWQAVTDATHPPPFVTNHPPFAGQFAWHAFNDPGYRLNGGSNPLGLSEEQILKNAFTICVARGVEIIEVFPTDINLTAAITYGHSLFFP